MLDGPMWGLTPDQDSKIVFRVLLTLLRLPGAFLLDIWWDGHTAEIIPRSLQLEALANSGWHLLPLVLASCFLLLPLRELVNLYLHIISGACLSLSVFSAYHFASEEISQPGARKFGSGYIKHHMTNGASYVMMTKIIRWCLNIKNPVFREICPQLYLLPLTVSFIGAPLDAVQLITNVTHGALALFVGVYTLNVLGKALLFVYQKSIDYSLIRQELGLGALVLVIRRMMEPTVLGSYFLAQLLAQIWTDVLVLEEKSYIIQDSDWLVQVLVTLSEVIYSPMMLIAFCIFIMTVSSLLVSGTQALLARFANVAGAGEPALPGGTTEGIVTFVLGLQTGLTDLEMPGRVGAVSIIMFVVVASLLQSCLDITYPVLLSMPTVQRRLSRHLVPIVITLLLMLTPMWMVYALLTKVSSDLWTLVIVSSCLVTAVQSLGHLVTYTIISWDCRQTAPSPNTDDYIFWVKAATKFGELLLAVAVVGGGFYESWVDDEDTDWSMLNWLVLLSHCYFNIFSRVTQGWSSYLARRKTSERLSLLRVATEKELSDHGDVCSICYMEMEHPSAVITDCQHFFHKACLKKWLVVQDNCPLCTKPIVKSEEEEGKEREGIIAGAEEEGVTDFESEENEEELDEIKPENQYFSEENIHTDSELRRRTARAGENLFEGD